MNIIPYNDANEAEAYNCLPPEIQRLINEVQKHLKDRDGIIRIVWHENILKLLKSICSPAPEDTIIESQRFFRMVWGLSNESYFPTIHLSYGNALGHYEGLWFPEICRNVRFLDSSIWHHFVHIPEENPSWAKKELTTIFEQICDNYKRGYYDLIVAKEYKELQERLLSQSYIKHYDGQEGHSILSPFLFHSENENKQRLISSDMRTLLDYNWRFLLVDDCSKSEYHAKDNIEYSGRPLSSQDESSGKEVFKEDIIQDRLKNLYKLLDIKESNKKENTITLECALNIEQAIEKLKSRKYDLILLDYKLDYKLDNHQYGYELLQTIKDNYNLQEIAGPHGRFYFMFISAYTTAVQERLRCEDFSVDTDYWFIGRGACPTNTPYLFLYCLKRMMEVRYNKLTEHSKQLLKDLNEDDLEASKEIYISMTMFLTKLYEKDKERNNCVKGFNAFLNLRRVYDIIKDDVDINNEEKSSRLILSMFKDEKYGSNSFWEHLQNLVYLTAFGTIRQWPEMWEDYIFIKGKLEKAESEYESYWVEDKYTKPSILIREYILSLKGMMS